MKAGNNDRSPAPSARPKRRRPWRWLGAFLLAVVVLVAAGAGFLLATEAGLRTAYRVAHLVVPGALTIGRLEGSLLGGPVIGDIELDLPAARVGIARLALDWRPARLLEGELHVVALEVAEARVALQETAEDTAPLDKLPTVALPLRLVVDHLRLSDLVVTPAGADEMVIVDSVLIAAEWSGTDLAIKTFEFVATQPKGEASLSGGVSLAGDYPLAAELQWRFAPTEDLPLSGEGRIEGDVERLSVIHRTEGAIRSELEGELYGLLDAPAWRGRLDLRKLALREFVPGAPPGLAGGSFEGQGTLEGFTVDGSVEADLDDYEALGSLHARVQAELADNVLSLTNLALGTSETAMSLQASGTYRIAGTAPGAFEASAEWRELGWPLGDTPQYRAPRGTLRASGTVDDFAHEVTARLEGTDLPPVDVEWRGRGNLASLTFESLRADTLDGRVEGSGEVAWAPLVTWSLELAAAGLQPAAHWPEFRGTLGAVLATTGRLADQLEARVDLEELTGELQDRPVAGQGSVQWRDDQMTVHDLALSVGPNRLALSGTVGQALALDADLDAPDLSVLLPDAAGQLQLRGRVTGRIERPELEGELAARALRFGETRLETADGRVHVAADREGVLGIDLRAAGLKAGDLAWEDVAVVANGTPSAHRFSLALAGEPLALSAEGDASWKEDGSYAGNLQTLALDSAEAGGWRLDRAAAFSVNGDAWEVRRLCLSSTKNLGGGCVAAEGVGNGRWKVDADVPRLDLGAFAVLVPAGMFVEGELRARARLAAEDNRLSGEARVELPSGTSRVDLEGEADQVLDFSGASASLKATGGDLAADIDLSLAGLGHVRSEARLPGWRLDAPARADQVVRATLKGRIPDLAPLNAVIPQVAELRGSVDADLNLNGTFGNARVDGAIRIAGTAFEVPAAGVRVGELSLVARSRTLDLLEYKGSARVGDGQIDLTGETRRTRDQGAVTRVNIKGEQLTVVDVPQAMVVVSPDLTFSLDRELAKLTGELVVPEARLRPRGIPAGSVSPSDDVVIKGESDEEDNLKLLTAADVRLKLGDKVSFEGFGLRGLFRGDLRITQEPGRLALGNGQLTIRDGTFATFGEELTIDQGRLVFANTPVYNPGINVVASRQYTDAKVGARVAGTLKKPRVTFFSDPPMGQAEALNYLLTGGGSSRGSAASGAAVVGGNLLVKEVGRQIGLDDVGVTRQDDSDDLSLYVGTYLTPQLYMQYVNEMGDKANKVRLRYDLTKKIQVEAETGDVQSFDVFYTIER